MGEWAVHSRPADGAAPAVAGRPVCGSRPSPGPPGAGRNHGPERWWLLDAETDGVYGASVDRAYREVLAGGSRGGPSSSRSSTPASTSSTRTWPAASGATRRDAGTARRRRQRLRRRRPRLELHRRAGRPARGRRHLRGDAALRGVRALLRRARPTRSRRGARGAEEECRRIARGFRRRSARERADAAADPADGRRRSAITAMLRAAARHGQLTVEAVRALRAAAQRRAAGAAGIYLQLAADDITPDDQPTSWSARALLELGLNPEFDPRPIVGDTTPTTRSASTATPTSSVPTRATAPASPASSRPAATTASASTASRRAVQIMTIRAVPNGDERDKDVANAIRYAVDTARTSST
jgi:hypothetical protein